MREVETSAKGERDSKQNLIEIKKDSRVEKKNK